MEGEISLEILTSHMRKYLSAPNTGASGGKILAVMSGTKKWGDRDIQTNSAIMCLRIASFTSSKIRCCKGVHSGLAGVPPSLRLLSWGSPAFDIAMNSEGLMTPLYQDPSTGW